MNEPLEIFDTLLLEPDTRKHAVSETLVHIDERLSDISASVQHLYGAVTPDSIKQQLSQGSRLSEIVPQLAERQKRFFENYPIQSLSFGISNSKLERLMYGDAEWETLINKDLMTASYFMDIASGIRAHIIHPHGDNDLGRNMIISWRFYDALSEFYGFFNNKLKEPTQVGGEVRQNLKHILGRLLLLCDKYANHDELIQMADKLPMQIASETNAMIALAQMMQVLFRVETNDPDISIILRDVRRKLSEHQ